MAMGLELAPTEGLLPSTLTSIGKAFKIFPFKTIRPVAIKSHRNECWIVSFQNYVIYGIACRTLVAMATARKIFKAFLLRNSWPDLKIIWHKCSLVDPLYNTYYPLKIFLDTAGPI